ncbi:DUF4270 domain-containing protein [uncultured Bacteroides sp.]|uniref:DUF4270 domain-containing protein n=1 Tax=uncultured Bacteroides sp. TaxID=162156 RepID=UPI002AABABD2|nr:DUF4270 domain-containing protein [uncultured Bacteroides sp.]
MKVKYLWASLLAFVLFSCDDTTGTLGLGMMPSSDSIALGAQTFDVSTETMLAGPVYAKTSMGYLGKYTDPEFGSFEADFLTQLTCTDQFEFPINRMVPVDPTASVKEYEATAASVNLYYTSYFGDSLNTCRLSVYELNKDLVKQDQSNYYTNIDPTQYYDSANGLIAKKAYSAVDLSISEATRKTSTFYPNVSVNYSLDKANQFIKLFQTSKAEGKNFKDEFAKAFKGIYVKCDHGDGTVLYIDQAHLNISFKVYAVDSLGHFPIKRKQAGYTTIDSTYTTTATFGSTKEVIQANSFKNDQTLEALAQVKDYTLIKSPAGLFTKVSLPVGEMAGKLQNDTLNSVKLTFNAYNKTDANKFGMSAPSYLLMVRAKDMNKFFEDNSLINNITSFLAPYSKTNNQYTFSNITRLISTSIADKKKATGSVPLDFKEEMVLVPVSVAYDSNNNLISIRHDLRPGYIKLKGGKDNKLKLEVIYSRLKK